MNSLSSAVCVKLNSALLLLLISSRFENLVKKIFQILYCLYHLFSVSFCLILSDNMMFTAELCSELQSSYYVFVAGCEWDAMCVVEVQDESGVINVKWTSVPYCPGSIPDTTLLEKPLLL
ncbi:hypothetical protein ATANTOWER_013362 [Ataeniobius toweri]|uniref:Uncharacterized protein n=1 Tax=Ataeniobius toweri TaxID=208326 RepID=A0ABU7B1V8_9TELE|nr:hypothetical protein [Ataeniobius toweri]